MYRFFLSQILLAAALVSISNVRAEDAAGDPDSEEVETVIILRSISGSGILRMRSSSGVESIAKSSDLLQEGDTITSDSRTSAELQLSDGSIIRLAPESEFRVERIKRSAPGIVSWAFQLMKGMTSASIRTEAVPRKKGDFKVRISTTSATMGVRGTEFTFGLDEGSGESILETHAGEVLLGSANANLADGKGIATVSSGYISSVPVGAEIALKPMPAEQGKQSRYMRFNHFFERGKALRTHPLELQKPVRNWNPAERGNLQKQIRRDFGAGGSRSRLQQDGNGPRGAMPSPRSGAGNAPRERIARERNNREGFANGNRSGIVPNRGNFQPGAGPQNGQFRPGPQQMQQQGQRAQPQRLAQPGGPQSRPAPAAAPAGGGGGRHR